MTRDTTLAARRAGALALWVVVVGAVLAALHVAGRGALTPPPLRSPSAWGTWLAGREPVVAAFALLRLLALAGAWYLAAVTVAGAAVRLASRQRLVAAVDRVTLPPLRRLLAATLSVGLGTLTPAMAAAHPPSIAAAAAATTSVPGPTTTTNPTGGGPPATLTMRQLQPPADDSPSAVPAADRPPPDGGRTWTVQPGQCFWSIAEAVLVEARGRPVAAKDIVPYWRRLVDANRPALADSDNPDLVFPGQVFTVPEP